MLAHFCMKCFLKYETCETVVLFVRGAPKTVQREQKLSQQMTSWTCWTVLGLRGDSMMTRGVLKLQLWDGWPCLNPSAWLQTLFIITSLHFVSWAKMWVNTKQEPNCFVEFCLKWTILWIVFYYTCAHFLLSSNLFPENISLKIFVIKRWVMKKSFLYFILFFLFRCKCNYLTIQKVRMLKNVFIQMFHFLNLQWQFHSALIFFIMKLGTGTW